jgi:hypothetical protein
MIRTYEDFVSEPLKTEAALRSVVSSDAAASSLSSTSLLAALSIALVALAQRFEKI